jgi:uncharacterized protein (TIGR02444 family)
MPESSENGFWNWAVAVYAKPGVAEASLRLQDEYGQCVPLLLWAAWAGEIDADTAQIAAALARAWSPVIEPLRGIRRRLKSEISPGDDNERQPLRAKVKAVELEAEKALMIRLEALGGGDAVALEVRKKAVAAVVAAWGGDCPEIALDAWIALL